ncbi:hypothetical protein BDV33DRAFT_205857 [Aspergillus novoparasiticus]|uniref:Uncharacterized protein n=1 Tax=Aspergillus novoparasiticus TaxID=986946 RepID=A0A5N6EJY0_9EURO|nr:hypothetical protein BDV33DRAFT_205857 [Aspergillus novoparasiticus]
MAYAAYHEQHPNLQGWQPAAFYDTDGGAVYEGEACELLYEILRRDDVVALLQYHRQCTNPIILRHSGYDWDNPFAYAIEHHGFRVLRVLVEIFPGKSDSSVNETLETYLAILDQHESTRQRFFAIF